jgi:hypothetical protein
MTSSQDKAAAANQNRRDSLSKNRAGSARVPLPTKKDATNAPAKKLTAAAIPPKASGGVITNRRGSMNNMANPTIQEEDAPAIDEKPLFELFNPKSYPDGLT